MKTIKEMCADIQRLTGVGAKKAWRGAWADARRFPGGTVTDEVGELVYWVRRTRSEGCPHPERLARRAQGRFPAGNRLRIVGW